MLRTLVSTKTVIKVNLKFIDKKFVVTIKLVVQINNYWSDQLRFKNSYRDLSHSAMET